VSHAKKAAVDHKTFPIEQLQSNHDEWWRGHFQEAQEAAATGQFCVELGMDLLPL
jgi:hypothetical protein